MIGLEKGQQTLLFALGAVALLALSGFGVFRLTRESDRAPTNRPQANAALGAIPPIDVDQPTQVETATFALG